MMDLIYFLFLHIFVKYHILVKLSEKKFSCKFLVFNILFKMGGIITEVNKIKNPQTRIFLFLILNIFLEYHTHQKLEIKKF